MPKRKIIKAENYENLSRFTVKTKDGKTLMDMPTISLFMETQLTRSHSVDLNQVDLFVDGKLQILWEDEP